VPFQSLCDVLAAFMIAAIGEDAAGFFQHEIYIGNGTLI
jgi:hypothetical protein